MIKSEKSMGRAAPSVRKAPAVRRDPDQVQSLLRAISLLDSIAGGSEQGVSLTDLAQEVGLAPSTAHRLLTTLEQARYVSFNPDGRLWTIGLQMFASGYGFVRSRNLAEVARPLMRSLMEEAGETVNLAIEDDGQAVYLAQVECRQMMRAFARPGSRVPLHCSGVGKAMLANMDDKAVAAILHKRGTPRLTMKTCTSPVQLRADLERTRAEGYSIDDEEHAVGLRCIGTAIFDETGEAIAAISVSGPVARIDDERLRVLANMAVATAGRISERMGASGPR